MFHKFFIISKYTFTDFLKSKILYITLVVGLATTLMTYIATEFTFGVPQKVAIDFGLGILSLSSLAISIFMGVNLLPKEIDSRTVYMVISRPVPRYVFITGKIFGLLGILALNIFLLSAMTLSCVLMLDGKIDSAFLVAILFNFLEATLLLLVVVFFSLFANTTLSTVISVLFLLAGHAIKEVQGSSFVVNRESLKLMLDFYHLILPAFYKLNFKEFVIYNQFIPGNYILNSLCYGTLYSLFLFLMIIHIFNRKNLD